MVFASCGDGEIDIKIITLEMLKSLSPKINITEEFLTLINQYASDFEIDTNLRKAHFLSQIFHESGGLKKTKELLSYSESRFLDLYRNTRTPNGVNFNDRESYKHLIKNDNKFANWRYGYINNKGILVNHRGRGYLHTTWKLNYQEYTNYYQWRYGVNIDFVEYPELLEDLPYSLESSFFFWDNNKINSFADLGSSRDHIEKVTKIINGGLNGIEDRVNKFNIIFNYLTR